MTRPDVVVVGGGVIGLASARELAQRGLRVTLVETNAIGGQASGAAAGMLAPGAEAHEASPFLDLLVASWQRYPALAEVLLEETGRSIELVQSGILRVAESSDSADQLRGRLGWLAEAGIRGEWIDRPVTIDPGQADRVAGALWLPDEGHVVSERLVGALSVAAAAAGAELRQGVAVNRLAGNTDRVTGVDTSDGLVEAEWVVLAAGAWSARLWPNLPVRPVRGQILAVGAPIAAAPPVMFGDSVYVVPKRDGSMVIGATEDDAGFDSRPTVAGIGWLLTEAPRLVPSLAHAPFLRAWAGLRPMTPDKLPVFGHLADGLVVATGHYRNGILLTPISGAIVADLVTGITPPVDLAPFAPDRFAVG